MTAKTAKERLRWVVAYDRMKHLDKRPFVGTEGHLGHLLAYAELLSDWMKRHLSDSHGWRLNG